MKKLKNTRVAGTAVLTAVLACCHSLKPEGPEATLTFVEPQTIDSSEDTSLTISGDSFSIALFRDVSCGHGTAIATDDSYAVEFISVEDESAVFFADEVNWLDERRLEVWIDAGSVPPGDYSLRVIDPWGRSSQLADAVEVSSFTDGDTHSDGETDKGTEDTETCSAPDTVSDGDDSDTWDVETSTDHDSQTIDTDSQTETEITCEEICLSASSSFDDPDEMTPHSADPAHAVWEHGTLDTGRTAWATLWGEPYKTCESARLTSRAIDMTPCDDRHVEVTFMLQYEYDSTFGSGSSYKDGLTVEFFNGQSWETVAPEGGWTVNNMETSHTPPDVIGCDQALEIVDHGCFSGSSEGWTPKVFRLDWSKFPPNFRFRLIHGSDWEKNYEGTYLDAVDFRPVAP